MIINDENEIVTFRCICGKEWTEMIPNDDFRASLLKLFSDQLCESCQEQQIANEKSEREKAEQEAFRLGLPRKISEAGIPEKYNPETPPVRFVAEWIWKHRMENILLSGSTGTGKSTSAGFVACRLIAERQKVRYLTLRMLLSDWRKAKTSDKSCADERMLSEIGHLDLLILDEFVNKATVSKSGQECLFEILERINNGEFRCRIWILGNFYTGCIADIFDDPAPVYRRFRENFNCQLIRQDTLTPIQFKEKTENGIER